MDAELVAYWQNRDRERAVRHTINLPRDMGRRWGQQPDTPQAQRRTLHGWFARRVSLRTVSVTHDATPYGLDSFAFWS